MKISPETIDRVRSASDIVAVVGEHVRLIKAGKAFKGLCPFHTEKTPSFMVNAERQTYHCFGCGAGGNAITFLMDYAKMSFPESVRYLGERAGIEIVAGPDDGNRETETARLFEALAFAATVYRECLLHTSAGEAARAYMAARGIDPELAAAFGLGFAPPGWQYLADLAGKRFTSEILTRAGLVIAREGGGGVYDRFRNRLMVPVLNHMGKTVGFGGRAIGDEEPKYINSPESPVYQKGNILFGLSQAREAMHREDTALVVEGYLDHLRVYGAGFRNVVAVAGTAFTSQQASLLKRFASRAVLVFDGDAAGVTASWRSASICLAAGLDVRLAALPTDHDPDSLIRDQGRDAFQRVLSGAADIVEFAADRFQAGGREEALHKLVPAIRECPDAIRRRLLVQAAAERLRFDEATLVKVVESNRGNSFSGIQEPASTPGAGGPADPVERGLMALLVTHPDALDGVQDLTGDDFRDPLCRELWTRLHEDESRTHWADRLMEADPASPLARFVSQLRVDSGGGGADVARDYVSKIIARRVRARMSLLNEKLREAEARNDEALSLSIRLEMKNLKSTLMTGARI
jgi:DNA primase